MASGGTGDVLAGTIGALLAQGLAPFDAARLGVYLHGLAGEAGPRADRRRGPARGRPARGPADGPQAARRGWPSGSGRAAGSGSAHASRPGRRRRDADADGGADGRSAPRASAPDAGRASRSRRGSRAAGPAAARRGRPGSSSTSTRCAATSRRSGAVVGPGVRVEPVVKADAYGHGAVPIALRARGGGRRRPLGRDPGRGVRAARRRASRLPLLVLYPVPPDAASRPPRGPAIAVSVGSGRADRADPRGRRLGRGGRRAGLEVHLEVETGLGRGGVAARRGRRRRRGGRGGARRAAGRRLDAPRGRRRPGQRARPGRAVRGGRRALRGRRRLGRRPGRPSGATSRAAAASWARTWRAGTPCGTGLADLRARPGRADAAAGARPSAAARLRPVMALKARPVRVAGPAGGPRRQLRPDVRHGPRRRGSRRCRSAMATAGDGSSPTGPTRSSAGVRVPLVGRVAMDAVMADVTDVPGAPVHEDDEFVLLGDAGRRADHRPRPRRGLRDDQLRDRHRRCPAGCPGCTMPPVRPWRSGRSRAGGPSGAHRALERRHLRPRGRRDREPRLDVAVDVDGRRGRAQARRAATRSSSPRSARRPVELGDAIVTPAGRLAAKVVIHAVSLERDRRTSGAAIDRAARSAMARVRELGLVERRVPGPRHRDRRLPAGRGRPDRRRRPSATSWRRRRRSSTSSSPCAAPPPTRRSRAPCRRRAGAVRPLLGRAVAPVGPAARDADQAPREATARPRELPDGAHRRAARGPRRGGGARDPAARPDRARPCTSSRRAGRTGRSARPRCCSSTRCCASCSAARSPSATELLRDDAGIEALIDRLEELDEADGWDA